ncbi:MAG: tetraacyldisaccharide 4'-kinase [Candidatus Binataceae bacterium]|jgi:tetraacyldisaccharide 4'-kinase
MARRSSSRPLIERLWQTPLPPQYLPIWAALVPASLIYGAALELRSRWWQAMAGRAEVPVISAGNLTAGGNGKTPFTLFLANRLRGRGFNAGIASRGWGRRASREAAAMVSDGERILLGVHQAGDEPLMMAKAFGGPIAVGRRRADAIALLAAHALSRGRPLDVVILDDGFQHLRLKRDLNLLLVNGSRGFGNRWLLPAGPMRDRLAAAARADAVVIIDGGEGQPANPSSDLASALGLDDWRELERHPLFHANLEPRALISSASDCDDREGDRWTEHPLALAGRRVVAVSGLADPAGFHAMLHRLGAQVIATMPFRDHHAYGPSDVENILDAARNAELVVTTEKDLVKLERFPRTSLPLYALRVEAVMALAEEARLLDLATAVIRH